jgi:hypothetical protein
LLFAVAVLAFGLSNMAAGQGRGAPAQAPPARAAARIDLTGYWVSVVNKEWRFRMVVPAKGDFFGDFGGIPINAEARRAAEAWDPARDEANGEQCKGFGAAGLMRVPGRLHITWQDDNTLRVDTDAGMQTRLFHFRAASAGGPPSWQGHSMARWLGVSAAGRGRGGAESENTGGPAYGSLEVVTTNLLPGYLRRNGVPYSGGTVMTEYWVFSRSPTVRIGWSSRRRSSIPHISRRRMRPAPHLSASGMERDPSPCSARW